MENIIIPDLLWKMNSILAVFDFWNRVEMYTMEYQGWGAGSLVPQAQAIRVCTDCKEG